MANKLRTSGLRALTTFALLCLSQTAIAKSRAPLTVILDAGHGGEDTGAIRNLGGQTISEKDLTLAIAREAAKILKSRGITTHLTRSTDTFVDLDARTESANRAARRAPQSVFVSIHLNATDDDTSTGVETYVFNAATNEASKRLADLENGKRWTKSHGMLDLILADLNTTANYAESASLACLIQKNVVTRLNSQGHHTRDRGIRQALFYVLMQTNMPSVLFEPGFLSNPKELERLTTPTYQRLLAQNLADGILTWHSSARTKSRANNRTLSAISKTACRIH